MVIYGIMLLGEVMKKNILVIYTSYGTGHYMAAKAIEEYILNNYSECNVEFLDPFSYTRPTINKLFAKTGALFATRFRRIRGLFYNKYMYRNYLKTPWYYNVCAKLFWNQKLEKKLKDFNPDIIISTQVGPTGLIAQHKYLFNAKLISVFTDYGLHRMYTVPHELVDIFCVSDKDIRKKMIDLGIKRNKIKVTGIPVHSKFVLNDKNNDKNKILNKYKLAKNKPFYLFVCGGGLGYDNAFKYFEKMLQANGDFSYIFIAGKNNKLFERAQRIASKYTKKGKVLGYVSNMDEFIKCSDMVIGKPGGIITSETLNSGVPMCAIEPIPGQETNNTAFIADNKFGFSINNTNEFQDLLAKINDGEMNLEEYKRNINNHFVKFEFLDINKI